MWLTKEKAFIVTIVYKSGFKVTARFSKFNVKGGTYEWTCAANRKYPERPLLMNVDNIETIWYHED